MSVTHGMDPRTVREIAGLLDDAAGQIQEISGAASTVVAALEWFGADVQRFEDQWSDQGRPQMALVADELRSAGKAMTGEVDAQDQASSNGGLAGVPFGGGPDQSGGDDDGGFWGWVGDTAGDLWDDVTGAGESLLDGAGDLFSGGLSLLGNGLNWVGDRVTDGLSWAADGVEWATDGIGSFISGGASFVGGLLDDIGLDGLGDAVSGFGDWLGGGIESFGDALPRVVDSLGGLVHSFGDPLSRGELPSFSGVAAATILAAGNIGGALANLGAGDDLHVFDDGTPTAGPAQQVTDPTAPANLNDMVQTVIDADAARDGDNGNVRITAVTHNGQTSYVVSVPGTSDWGPGTGSQSPLDLTGNLVAMTGSPSTAMQAVQQAMAANIPPGAPVMMVGHSQGGIITSQLVSDPSFMSQFNVTNMLTYGSPIDTASIPPQVQTLALQHTTDIVPKLDLGGATQPGLPDFSPAGSNVQTVTLPNVGDTWNPFAQHGGATYQDSIQHATGGDAAALQQYQSTIGQYLVTDNGQVTAVDIPIGRKVEEDG